jgi:transposase
VIPHGVEIFMAREPVNMRLSFDRLAGLAESVMGRSARSSALFVFFGKRRDAVKVLFHDGSGLFICYKRLDKGCFRIPDIGSDAAYLELTEHELEDLLDGIALAPASRRKSCGPTMH